jgi:hypothetical protein
VACLEDDHVDAAFAQIEGAGEPGHPRSHDDYVRPHESGA